MSRPKNSEARVNVSKKLLAINSAGTVVGRLFDIAVMVWVIQHLINRIEPDEFQLLPVVQSISLVLPLLTRILTNGLVRYVTDAYARDEHKRITTIATSMGVLNSIVAVIMIVPVTLLCWHIDSVLTFPTDRINEARLMMAAMLAPVLLSLPTLTLSVGLQTTQKYVLLSILHAIATLARALLTLALILGLGPKVMWVAIAMAAAQLFGHLLVMIFSLRALPSLRWKRGYWSWSVVKEVAVFGFWTACGEAAGVIRNAADPIVLNRLANAVEVNCFHVASIIDRQLRALMVVVLSPIVPVLTTLHATDREDQMQRALIRSTRIVLWAGLFPAVPLLIYRNELLQLYLGDAFKIYPQASLVVLLLSLCYPWTFSVMLFYRMALARANVRPYTIRTTVIHVFNLALTLVLVGPLQYGAVGSAAATLICESLGFQLLIFPLGLQCANLTLARFAREVLLPGIAPAITVGAIIWALYSIGLVPDSWSLMLGAGTAIALLYAPACWVWMDQAERRDALHYVNRIRERIRKRNQAKNNMS